MSEVPLLPSVPRHASALKPVSLNPEPATLIPAHLRTQHKGTPLLMTLLDLPCPSEIRDYLKEFGVKRG